MSVPASQASIRPSRPDRPLRARHPLGLTHGAAAFGLALVALSLARWDGWELFGIAGDLARSFALAWAPVLLIVMALSLLPRMAGERIWFRRPPRRGQGRWWTKLLGVGLLHWATFALGALPSVGVLAFRPGVLAVSFLLFVATALCAATLLVPLIDGPSRA